MTRVMTTTAAARRDARRRVLAPALLTVLLVGLLAGGLWAARQPASPVRDWVERRPTDLTSLALTAPDDPPATYDPGEPLVIRAQVQRTTSPSAPQDVERVSWTATWQPTGGSATRLAAGQLDVAPGATAPLTAEVTVPGTAPGTLVVALGSGQRIVLGLEAAGG